MLDSFIDAAEALGREPEMHFVPNPGLHGPVEIGVATAGAAGLLGRVDSLNVLVGGRRLARRVRHARSLWVVAAAASAGIAAPLSGRPYACWVATSLADEWQARESALARSRRAALRLNRPGLLRLERRVLRGASAVFAASPATQRAVAAAAGLPVERVRLLPIGVDTDRFAPLPDDGWLERLDEPTIVFVGRGDDPRKNVKLLLEALPIIRRRVPGATVRLIGRPPREPLPAGASAAGVVADLAAELRTASLFMLPSLQEGFGIVAAEALACGVPVVTTPSGGPEELVAASGGGIVLSGWGAEEVAEVVAGLLLERPDLLRMRRAGREHVVARYSQARLRTDLAEAFSRLDG
jgi:glycosyltransferase involved in cell wall biosynthesis